MVKTKIFSVVILATVTYLWWGMWISCASDSMAPSMTCHDKLGLKFLQPDQRSNLSIGDIVVYSATMQQRYAARQMGWTWTTTYLIHRIVGKNSTGYVIKGDNNPVADNEYFGNIKFYQVSYKVMYINNKSTDEWKIILDEQNKLFESTKELIRGENVW